MRNIYIQHINATHGRNILNIILCFIICTFLVFGFSLQSNSSSYQNPNVDDVLTIEAPFSPTGSRVSDIFPGIAFFEEEVEEDSFVEELFGFKLPRIIYSYKQSEYLSLILNIKNGYAEPSYKPPA